MAPKPPHRTPVVQQLAAKPIALGCPKLSSAPRLEKVETQQQLAAEPIVLEGAKLSGAPVLNSDEGDDVRLP